jgi:hypothetical protein
VAWCRISAGINRIANRFFIVKAACRSPTIPRAEQAEKGDANTSSRKGQTRVNYRKLITSWISIFSRYRDHNLQTELRKISFKLFSNRTRILCGAKIQVLFAKFFESPSSSYRPIFGRLSTESQRRSRTVAAEDRVSHQSLLTAYRRLAASATLLLRRRSWLGFAATSSSRFPTATARLVSASSTARMINRLIMLGGTTAFVAACTAAL